MSTIFGQIVIGPPGSGKSTYCKYIFESLKSIGRNPKIINLDPGNDNLQYKPTINLTDYIKLEQVMQEFTLGPNGAIIKSMEILEQNFAWLYDKIVDLLVEEKRRSKEEEGPERTKNPLQDRPYLLFDCPGQSELYTHHRSMKNITNKLTGRNDHYDLRLVCMNLCDSYHASDLGKFIGLVMNSLQSMINLELPHINLLSKLDVIEKYGATRFNVDFYCEVANLDYLLQTELDNPFFEKYRKLTKNIIGLIEDYSLVSFIPLNIREPEDIFRVLKNADKANGYFCDDLDLHFLQVSPTLMELASGRRLENLNDNV